MTKNLTLHSPGPWELVEATEHHGPYIVGHWGGTVADLYAMSNPTFPSTRNGGISRPLPFDSADANAAFIVKACNSHKALVEALEKIACFDDKRAQERLEVTGQYSSFDDPGSVEIARAALDLVKSWDR